MQFFKIRSKNFFHHSAVLMQICQKCFHSQPTYCKMWKKIASKMYVRIFCHFHMMDWICIRENLFFFCFVAASHCEWLNQWCFIIIIIIIHFIIQTYHYNTIVKRIRKLKKLYVHLNFLENLFFNKVEMN